jgi:hypothetical protein
MDANTLKLLRKFKPKLQRYVSLEQTHCGFEQDVKAAERVRDKLLEWLGAEIEAANQRAINQSNNLHRGPG